MFPSIEEVVRLAKTKKYKRIPVAIEMLSDSLTTIEAVRILRNASHQCYLLEVLVRQRPGEDIHS